MLYIEFSMSLLGLFYCNWVLYYSLYTHFLHAYFLLPYSQKIWKIERETMVARTMTRQNQPLLDQNRIVFSQKTNNISSSLQCKGEYENWSFKTALNLQKQRDKFLLIKCALHSNFAHNWAHNRLIEQKNKIKISRI